jgi:hypothetical protein
VSVDKTGRATQRARERRNRIYLGVIGEYDRVPVADVAALVRSALDEGVSLTLIASCAGVNRSTVRDIADSEPEHMILASTHAAMLRGLGAARRRTRSGEVAPRRVLAEPYRTKMRRLGAAGWGIKELLAVAHIPENVVRDRAIYIAPETAEAIDRIYAEYEALPGPNLQVARYWRKRGYLVPAAETEADMLPLSPTESQMRERRRRTRARRERRLRQNERQSA